MATFIRGLACASETSMYLASLPPSLSKWLSNMSAGSCGRENSPCRKRHITTLPPTSLIDRNDFGLTVNNRRRHAEYSHAFASLSVFPACPVFFNHLPL